MVVRRSSTFQIGSADVERGARKMGMRRNVQRHYHCHYGLGIIVGFLLGCFVTSRFRGSLMSASSGSRADSFSCVWSNRYVVPVDSDDVIPDLVTENDTLAGKNLIFIGVMTAQKYLDTRARAVYETWAKTLPGKIAFFTSASSRTRERLPLIRLTGVDDSYPPQKKSFLMLKYIHDHYLEKFEWFMRADDDVYVRGDKLETFLRSINSSRPHFIGQAGMGNKEEFGQLSLDDGDNFCMGGPGMILSRETLRRVVPHIKYCLKNLFSSHEDVEVGRCIHRFAGIPCTWSYEMQNIFYHNSSGSEAFTGNLRNKEVHRAFTLHPVKDHQHLYRLHNYMQALQIQELQQKILLIMRDIHDVAANVSNAPILYKTLNKNSESLGKGPSLNKFIPYNSSEVISWDFFTKVIFSDSNSNPKRRIESPMKIALDDVVTQIMENINKYSQQRGRTIDFKEILYGYRRLVPKYGVDYILDMLLVYKKYRGRKMTIPVRRHAYLQQSFTQMHFRELMSDENHIAPTFNLFNLVQKHIDHFGSTDVPPTDNSSSIKDKIIHFIVPLGDRFSTFQRFMTNFEDVCLKNNENVKLTVVLFRTANDSQFSQSIDLIEKMQKRYVQYNLNTVVVNSQFSRALALEMGAAQFVSDALLFFLDVDIYFTRAVLERVRLNTVQGDQVYYPIVFSQFDPRIVYGEVPISPDYVVDENAGYWRQYGFGIVAIYKDDFTAVGGFDTSIQGWGREDVDLFEKVLRSNLTIFRSVDPGLIHIFHSIECSRNLIQEQYDMCSGTRASSLGSQHKLAETVYRTILTEDGSFNL